MLTSLISNLKVWHCSRLIVTFKTAPHYCFFYFNTFRQSQYHFIFISSPDFTYVDIFAFDSSYTFYGAGRTLNIYFSGDLMLSSWYLSSMLPWSSRLIAVLAGFQSHGYVYLIACNRNEVDYVAAFIHRYQRLKLPYPLSVPLLIIHQALTLDSSTFFSSVYFPPFGIRFRFYQDCFFGQTLLFVNLYISFSSDQVSYFDGNLVFRFAFQPCVLGTSASTFTLFFP